MKSTLSTEYFRLMLSETKEDKKESYSKVVDAGFQILNPVHEKIIGDLRTAQNQDAMILFQMVISKGLAIQKLIDGVDYKNPKTEITTNILDPTSIAALTRTQFEAFSNFHNIYLSSKDQNVIDLLHDLWVIAGLNERQRGFEPTIEEHKIKAAQEKSKIDGLIERIKVNSVFCQEDTNKQGKILDWISKRKFEITYRNNKLVLLSQKDLFLNSGVNEAFENQYSLLSWFVHPSYISVLQFGQMYEKNFNEQHAYTFLRISRIIMSMLIADYNTYFDVAMEEYKNLPKIDQLIIHSDNKTFRPNSEFKSDAMADLENEIVELLKKT
jgi:hypothetical protein